MLNKMCESCACLGIECNGTESQVWSGCIYRKTESELNKLDNVVNYIYDKTNAEMMAIAKTIKAGGKVLPIVKEAFEKVLNIRYAERLEVYKYYYSC